jgi:hypothetical protein
MLKKFIVTVALMGVTAYSYSQGTVDFDTKAVGARVSYTVQFQPGSLFASGNNPVNGTAFYGQLYAAAGAGALEATLQPVGTRLGFRGAGGQGVNAGYLQDLEPVTVTPTGGGPATIQLRAWTGADTTYEIAEVAALAGTPGYGAGKSALTTLAATGNPNGTPPTTQVPLDGLTGFSFQVNNIPEPSTVALGVLGAAALLFARRRK